MGWIEDVIAIVTLVILLIFRSLISKIFDALATKILKFLHLGKALGLETAEKDAILSKLSKQNEMLKEHKKELKNIEQKIGVDNKATEIVAKFIEKPIYASGDEYKVSNNSPILNIEAPSVRYNAALLYIVQSIPVLKFLEPEAKVGCIYFYVEKFVDETKDEGLKEFIKSETVRLENQTWLTVFKKLNGMGWLDGIINPYVKKIQEKGLNDEVIKDFTEMCKSLSAEPSGQELSYKIGDEKIAIIKIGRRHLRQRKKRSLEENFILKIMELKKQGYNSIFLLSRGYYNEIATLLAEISKRAFNDISYSLFAVKTGIHTKDMESRITHIRKI